MVGGIPVYRDNPSTLIENVVEIVKKKSIIIAMTQRVQEKSKKMEDRFSKNCKTNSVKILLISIDAPTKSIGIGKIFNPTGDNEKDLAYSKLL